MLINEYINGIAANISNKTNKNSITPFIVGKGFTDLATIFSGFTNTNFDSKYLSISSGITITNLQSNITSLINDLSNFQPIGNYVSANTLSNYYTAIQTDNIFAIKSTTLSGYSISYNDTLFDKKYAPYSLLIGNPIQIRSIDKPTSITDIDSIINITGGTFTQNLPDTFSHIFNIKNSGNGIITLSGNSIDGKTSFNINSNDSVTLAYLGTTGNYIII